MIESWEVTTDLIVHCKVKVTVQADGRDAAIEAAAELLPSNFDRDSALAWKAKVELRPPDGVNIKVLRAYHFEQASGSDTARRVSAK